MSEHTVKVLMNKYGIQMRKSIRFNNETELFKELAMMVYWDLMHQWVDDIALSF